MDIRPNVRHHDEDRGYVPPRKTVLLVSCMDPRLLDDLTRFMNADNLTNRYDHVIFAGAALGVNQTTFPHWRQTFFDHLGLAIQLHGIEDVYVVEHRACGAYHEFLGLDYGDSPDEQAREEADHRVQAVALRDAIAAWTAGRTKPDGKPLKLRVLAFLMDLRGHVTLLAGPDDCGPPARNEPAPAPAAPPASPGRKTSKTKKGKS